MHDRVIGSPPTVAPRALMDRRAALKFLLGSTGLVVGCSPRTYVDSACGAEVRQWSDCNRLPLLDMPSGYEEGINQLVTPFRRITGIGARNYLIYFHQSQNDAAGGYATSSSRVDVYLPNTSTDSLEVGRVAVLDLAINQFNINNRYRRDAPSDYVRDEIEKRTDRETRLAGFYTNSEFSIMRESSYFEDNPLAANFGYPEASWSDLLASLVTVMRLKPKEFMAKIRGLKEAESKKVMATTGLVCLEALRKFSPDSLVTYEDLQFDPELVAFLQSEGQTAN